MVAVEVTGGPTIDFVPGRRVLRTAFFFFPGVTCKLAKSYI